MELGTHPKKKPSIRLNLIQEWHQVCDKKETLDIVTLCVGERFEERPWNSRFEQDASWGSLAGLLDGWPKTYPCTSKFWGLSSFRKPSFWILNHKIMMGVHNTCRISTWNCWGKLFQCVWKDKMIWEISKEGPFTADTVKFSIGYVDFLQFVSATFSFVPRLKQTSYFCWTFMRPLLLMGFQMAAASRLSS